MIFSFPPSKCFWRREKQTRAGELGLYPLLVTPLGTPSLVTQPCSQGCGRTWWGSSRAVGPSGHGAHGLYPGLITWKCGWGECELNSLGNIKVCFFSVSASDPWGCPHIRCLPVRPGSLSTAPLDSWQCPVWGCRRKDLPHWISSLCYDEVFFYACALVQVSENLKQNSGSK